MTATEKTVALSLSFLLYFSYSYTFQDVANSFCSSSTHQPPCLPGCAQKYNDQLPQIEIKPLKEMNLVHIKQMHWRYRTCFQHLAFVFLGCWVEVCDHGGSVGYKDGIHHTTGHHADHHNPHLYVIYRVKQQGKNLLYSSAFKGKKHVKKRRRLTLTCWSIHGSVRESNHLGKSSENSPRVFNDDRGILEEIGSHCLLHSGARQTS